MPLDVRLERLEDVAMEARDPLQDSDLDRVHVDGAEHIDRQWGGGRRSPEARERGEDLSTVVGLVVVPPHDDPVLADPHAIRHARQVGEHPLRVADERRERLRVDVPAQAGAEGGERSRGGRSLLERVRDGNDGTLVLVRGLELPAMPFERVRDRRGEPQVLVDDVHPSGEVAQRAAEPRRSRGRGTPRAGTDGIGIAEASEEPCPAFRVGMVVPQGRGNVVEMQVAGERRHRHGRIGVWAIARPEQDPGRERGSLLEREHVARIVRADAGRAPGTVRSTRVGAAGGGRSGDERRRRGLALSRGERG